MKTKSSRTEEEFNLREVTHLGGNIWVDGHILLLATGNRRQTWHVLERMQTSSIGHPDAETRHTADQLLPDMTLVTTSLPNNFKSLRNMIF